MVVGFTTSCSISVIQHYVIKFFRDLWQVDGFLRVLWVLPPHDITEILLKVALNTITLTLTLKFLVSLKFSYIFVLFLVYSTDEDFT